MSTNQPYDFINLAYGGASVASYQDAWYPADFAIPGKPEYGKSTPNLKPADHFRGVTYGNKRSFDFANDLEDLGCRVKAGTRVGILAVPQYSFMTGLEVSVDSVFADPSNTPVTGVVAIFKLASTGETLGTVPLDVKGRTYIEFNAALIADRYTDYGNDAIEMILNGVPVIPPAGDEFLCVPLPCPDCFNLCLSVAVNFVHNLMEPKCLRPCDLSPQ